MDDIRVQIRIPADLHKQLIQAADERRIGVDLIVRRALEDALTEENNDD